MTDTAVLLALGSVFPGKHRPLWATPNGATWRTEERPNVREKKENQKAWWTVWKKKSLYGSRIWIRIVALDAAMGSRSSYTPHQTLPAALRWPLLEQILLANRPNSMYKALLKPRGWLPKGTFQCPSPSGSPQVFLSPQRNVDISAAHQYLRLVSRPGKAGAHRVDSQDEGAEVPCQRMASWEYGLSSSLLKGRKVPAGRNGAIDLSDGGWATAGGKPTHQLWHKLQKHRRAVDGWAVGRWDQSLPDSRRCLWPLQWKSN